jgi:hypothetical protein
MSSRLNQEAEDGVGEAYPSNKTLRILIDRSLIREDELVMKNPSVHVGLNE